MQQLSDFLNLLAPYLPGISAFLAGAAAQKFFKLAEVILSILPKRTPPLTAADIVAAIKEAKDAG